MLRVFLGGFCPAPKKMKDEANIILCLTFLMESFLMIYFYINIYFPIGSDSWCLMPLSTFSPRSYPENR